MHNLTDAKTILLLGSALAIGLLIGVERGWKLREAQEGERLAGLRTYGLIGLLGGGAGVLAQFQGAMLLGWFFVGFAVAMTVPYVMLRRPSGDINTKDISMTSLVTMLLTFVLGALATLDHVVLAASAAVVTTTLLGFKFELHNWLRKLEQKELRAALQLLLISVVLLPILPNQGYGPWNALNLYEIWWMVVLIAAISFTGYFAKKIAGEQTGVLVTALAAGLASSTALTLQYARQSRKKEGSKDLLAAGILLASGVMFMRMLLVANVVNPNLLPLMGAPMLAMTFITVLSATVFWRKSKKYTGVAETVQLTNVLEIKMALLFGTLLALVMLLAKTAIHYLGSSGLFAVAAVSGLADVDAISLTLSRMSINGVASDIAVFGIVLAAASNTLVKAFYASIVGSVGFGIRVMLPLFAAAGMGLVIAWLR